MTRVLRLAAIAVLCVSFVPTAGSAFNGPGCGGDWTTSKSCPFKMAGLPLTMFADAAGTGARVRVWISPSGSPEVPLAICDTTLPPAQSGTYVTTNECRFNEFPLAKGDTPPEAQWFPFETLTHNTALQCNVQGAPKGRYQCASGHQQS